MTRDVTPSVDEEKNKSVVYSEGSEGGSVEGDGREQRRRHAGQRSRVGHVQFARHQPVEEALRLDALHQQQRVRVRALTFRTHTHTQNKVAY